MTTCLSINNPDMCLSMDLSISACIPSTCWYPVFLFLDCILDFPHCNFFFIYKSVYRHIAEVMNNCWFWAIKDWTEMFFPALCFFFFLWFQWFPICTIYRQLRDVLADNVFTNLYAVFESPLAAASWHDDTIVHCFLISFSLTWAVFTPRNSSQNNLFALAWHETTDCETRKP